jgi:beta-1,4-mannosyltransferase
LKSLKCLSHYLQVYAERDVSFDNGPDGSVAEDCFFAMKAFSKGYSFDWIEGEMYEKSPFTLMDFIQQRKRWLQGILLVVQSKEIPFRYKMFLTISVYSWCLMPLAISNVFFAIQYPLPCPYIVDSVCAFLGGISIYMYIFGTIKSFSLSRFGFFKTIIGVLGSLCTIPLNMLTENTAVAWGVLTNKHKFYVVKKEFSKETEPLITA